MNFRPTMSMLRNEDVERIISGAYDLLATTGVKIIHQEALQILSDHGASVDFSAQVATMPRDLVEKCLKTVPSSLEFYNFAGDETVSLNESLFFIPLPDSAIFREDPLITAFMGPFVLLPPFALNEPT